MVANDEKEILYNEILGYVMNVPNNTSTWYLLDHLLSGKGLTLPIESS